MITTRPRVVVFPKRTRLLRHPIEVANRLIQDHCVLFLFVQPKQAQVIPDEDVARVDVVKAILSLRAKVRLDERAKIRVLRAKF